LANVNDDWSSETVTVASLSLEAPGTPSAAITMPVFNIYMAQKTEQILKIRIMDAHSCDFVFPPHPG
jgi:hypothetical protein